MAIILSALAGASIWRANQASAAPVITVSSLDGFVSGDRVVWNIWFENSGPAVTVDLSDSYEPNGTGTNLAGTNGPMSGCAYTQVSTLWEDCEVNLNASNVNNGKTLVSFSTTVPPASCAGPRTVANTVSALLNGVAIPPTPGKDTTGEFTQPPPPDCPSPSIDKLDSTKLVDDGGSIEWTIWLQNPATAAEWMAVRDLGATLVTSNCEGGNTAEVIDDVIVCLVPGGDAGGQPEATIVVKTPYTPTPLEECKGATRTNYAELAHLPEAFAPALGALSDEATATITPPNGAPHCITVKKTMVSEGTWHITFTNTGAETGINFSDTYEGLGGQITGIAVNGAQVPGCQYDAYSHEATGCQLTLPSGVQTPTETTVVVTTDQVAGTCAGVKVTNTVRAFFGMTQVSELNGSPSVAEYEEQQDCYRVIQLCKAWTLDAPGEASDGDASFQFWLWDQDKGKGDSPDLITIPGVTEGGSPECVLLSVRIGLVTIDEVGPSAGFVFDGITASGNDVPEIGPIEYTDRAFSFVVHDDMCAEATPGIAASVLGLVREVQQVVVIDPPSPAPALCTLTYFNHDTQDRLPTGALTIEKYRDVNGDGDAEDLALGEGPLDWDVYVSGPDAAVSGDHTLVGGTLTLFGLEPGDVYTVTEGTLPGWSVTNVTVDGVSYGASDTAVATIPGAGATIVRFFNQQTGVLHVHKTAETSANGSIQPAPDDDDGWTITVSSAGCGVNLAKQTDANGNVSFTGLPMCTDYVVSESPVNPASPGFVPVGAAVYSGQTPGGQTLTFVNRRTTTTSPSCQDCSPTPTPAPPAPVTDPPPPIVDAATATPTAKPPQATPTQAAPTTAPTRQATQETDEVTVVAGAKTPGPGATPIAPSAGSGDAGDGESSVSILLALGGLLAAFGTTSLIACVRRLL